VEDAGAASARKGLYPEPGPENWELARPKKTHTQVVDTDKRVPIGSTCLESPRPQPPTCIIGANFYFSCRNKARHGPGPKEQAARAKRQPAT
jgi:hypothetical protein